MDFRRLVVAHGRRTNQNQGHRLSLVPPDLVGYLLGYGDVVFHCGSIRVGADGDAGQFFELVGVHQHVQDVDGSLLQVSHVLSDRLIRAPTV